MKKAQADLSRTSAEDIAIMRTLGIDVPPDVLEALEEEENRKPQKPADVNGRTKDWYRERGYVYARVDRWNSFGGRGEKKEGAVPEADAFANKGIWVDLFGMFDAIAFKSGEVGVIGVQVTTEDNVTGRKSKALKTDIDNQTDLPRRDVLRAWLEAGNRMVIHGWERIPHGRSVRWVSTQYDLTLEDVDARDAGRNRTPMRPTAGARAKKPSK